MSFTPLDVSHQLRYAEVIGQSLAGDFQFRKSAIIIAVAPIKIPCTREVRFTRIGTKPSRRLDGSLGQGQTRRRMIDAKPIKRVMSAGELTICIEKRWITRHGVVQQIDCLE